MPEHGQRSADAKLDVQRGDAGLAARSSNQTKTTNHNHTNNDQAGAVTSPPQISFGVVATATTFEFFPIDNPPSGKLFSESEGVNVEKEQTQGPVGRQHVRDSLHGEGTQENCAEGPRTSR